MLPKRGLLPVYGIYRALSDKGRTRGYAVELSLPPAWPRDSLLEMAKAGRVSAADACFALVAEPPELKDALPIEDGHAAAMGALQFWGAFVREAYDNLRDRGPLLAEDIMKSGRVDALTPAPTVPPAMATTSCPLGMPAGRTTCGR